MKPSWRLTNTQKFDILRRYRAGEKVESIAVDFGIREQTVSVMARRRGLPLRRPDLSAALKAFYAPAVAAASN